MVFYILVLFLIVHCNYQQLNDPFSIINNDTVSDSMEVIQNDKNVAEDNNKNKRCIHSFHFILNYLYRVKTFSSYGKKLLYNVPC